MGNQDTNYVLDTNRSLPVVLHDGEAFYLYGLDPIARIKTTGPQAQRQQYYHYDRLGSTRALTDANGNTQATYNYDAFGAIRSQTGNVTNDFQYTGEQKDAESQYYFLRARYYDPGIGRFITRDPVSGAAETPQSLNAYVYVSNNAANRVDPSGLAGEAPVLLPGKRQPPELPGIDFLRRFCRNVFELCGEGGKEPIEPGAPGGPSSAGQATGGIKATTHGSQRLAEQNWARTEYEIVKAAGRQFTQADGTKAYVLEESPGRFRFIVEGDRGVITAHKNMPREAMDGFAERYGWSGWP